MNGNRTKRDELEIREVASEHEAALTLFFAALQTNASAAFFQPHPLTAEAARERASYVGRDVYAVLVGNGEVLGYGMLRGWDAGFAIPSLGIAIHPAQQGKGLGRLMMEYLHAAARRRQASKIRLRVKVDNTAAQKLYRSLGYIFSEQQRDSYIIGIRDFTSSKYNVS